MTRPTPVVLSWSGGKDSALALHALLMDPSLEVRGLLTTVTTEYDRISMHGVRSALLESQSRSLGMPVTTVAIPPGASNEVYQSAMGAALGALAGEGIEAIAFGDLYLADVRSYRENLVASAGLRALFPLWGTDTRSLARQFLGCGFRAVVVCVDPKAVEPALCGAEFDAQFLERLPRGADPCGENGEFHTFVFDGPMFTTAIDFRRGDVVERAGFVFCDLLQRDAEPATSGDLRRSGIPRA